MDFIASVIRYIADVTGATPKLKPMARIALRSLPIYLAQSYGLYELELFGHPLQLALVKGNMPASLKQLARDREEIAGKLGRDLALVLPQLRSYERNRLVQRRVPFIVPGRQMFLPMFLVDLRESFPAKQPQPAGHLGWVAQVMMLRHLLAGDIMDRPLASIAALLGYSAMAISQGLDQLVALELCQKVVAGRTTTIKFGDVPGTLWKKAQPHLRSPVKMRIFLESLDTRHTARPLQAGITALAELTDLAASPPKVLALADKEVRRLLAEMKVVTTPLQEEASLVLEGWAYHPTRLSDGPTVDPLSLYLSLKGDPDERVQMALDHLMEKWS